MARFPALVNALTVTDGRPRATVDLIGRTIRDGGLLSAGKRGEGASHMTVRDAANFLIGANAVQSPSLAAAAVRQFRTLKQSPHGRHVSQRSSSPALTAALRQLGACETLGAAIELLVAGAGDLDDLFVDWTDRAFGEGVDHRLLGPSLTVTFTRSAEIAFRFPQAEGPAPSGGHVFLFIADVDRLFEGFYTALDAGADRCVATSIGLPTFCALHDCIFDREPAAGDDPGC